MMSNWINVKDRLPESGERVLIYISNQPAVGIYFDHDDQWYLCHTDGYNGEIDFVKHWKPLDPPPENE